MFTLSRAFIVYVKPSVDYALSVWWPYPVNQVKLLNLRRGSSPKYLRVTPRRVIRTCLNWGTRDTTRYLRTDYIWVWPTKRRTTINYIAHYTLWNTRVHAYKLYPHKRRVHLRKHFFSERVVTPFNNSSVTKKIKTVSYTNEKLCGLFLFRMSFNRLFNSTNLIYLLLDWFVIQSYSIVHGDLRRHIMTGYLMK